MGINEVILFKYPLILPFWNGNIYLQKNLNNGKEIYFCVLAAFPPLPGAGRRGLSFPSIDDLTDRGADRNFPGQGA